MTGPGTIRFTAADQRSFARLSGDFNPVHLDPVVSRRVGPGEPIVHGMHLLLRALEIHVADSSVRRRLTLAVTFLRPAFLHELIRVESTAEGTVSAHSDGGVEVARAQIASASGPTRPAIAPNRRSRMAPGAAHRAPTVHTLADVAGAAGVIELATTGSVRHAFPRLARALGADVVAAMAGISKLVGMECPGRDSILSGLRLNLTPHARAARLGWRVARADRRFGLVRIEVCGQGVTGTVDAFLRPPPAALPTIAAAATRVGPAEFTGQRALVVGGSRGLGAAAAMLLAAGGGLPIVTYASGAAEAAALQADARLAGRKIETLRFDLVDDDAATSLGEAAARFRPTHLYYFATPRIFARRREPFDDKLFERFAAFYVGGFARVCASLGPAVQTVDVFYPSSTAIEQQPAELAEYVAAKSAGESLCRLLERQTRGLRILVRRLPRVATDQTASVVAARARDPYDVMLPIVREMQQRFRAHEG